jgi:transcriptional regulator GlxA family with amidase domain
MMQNFQQEIHLEQVASLVNMSESAFSRYFKHRTRETFSHILTEIRIEYACKMLQEKIFLLRISVLNQAFRMFQTLIDSLKR